jgi:hypothetical protein
MLILLGRLKSANRNHMYLYRLYNKMGNYKKKIKKNRNHLKPMSHNNSSIITPETGLSRKEVKEKYAVGNCVEACTE